MKVTDCCGAEAYSNGDSSTEDYGICPDCKEHCEYIEICDRCCEENCVCDGNREPAKIFNINS